MSCKSCAERRKLALDALVNAKVSEAVRHSITGVAEMTGLKRKITRHEAGAKPSTGQTEQEK